MTALALRVPAWAAQASVEADGTSASAAPSADGYLHLEVRDGSRVVLDLPMPVDVLDPHPRADALRGCVALRRGPVVYCIEQVDLPPGIVLEDVRLDVATPPRTGPGQESLRTGASVLATGIVRTTEGTPLGTAHPRSSRSEARSAMLPTRINLRAIPYARWANRARGAMRVWIPIDAEGQPE